MENKAKTLSSKSRAVLELIAQGHNYDQILSAYPALTYPDIFGAAQEALETLGAVQTRAEERTARIRQSYPRAYEKWSAEEDASLRQEFESGKDVKEIATSHNRQPSAIRSRLLRLGLVENAKPE
jgi:uncharacterized protein (DUF433 family)